MSSVIHAGLIPRRHRSFFNYDFIQSKHGRALRNKGWWYGRKNHSLFPSRRNLRWENKGLFGSSRHGRASHQIFFPFAKWNGKNHWHFFYAPLPEWGYSRLLRPNHRCQPLGMGSIPICIRVHVFSPTPQQWVCLAIIRTFLPKESKS